jgi:hypothetical protein
VLRCPPAEEASAFLKQLRVFAMLAAILLVLNEARRWTLALIKEHVELCPKDIIGLSDLHDQFPAK